MIAALLIAATGQTGFSLPEPNRLQATCAASDCQRMPVGERYRIDRVDARTPSAKDRAFANDGTYCSVVGARRCTRKARTIFSTQFGD